MSTSTTGPRQHYLAQPAPVATRGAFRSASPVPTPAAPPARPAAGHPRAAAAPSKPGPATFAEAREAAPAKPTRTVTLPPSAWTSTWADKQAEPVEVGMRLYSEADAMKARAYADQVAWKHHPQEADEEDRIAARNGALMAYIVARATCDPSDVSLPFLPLCPAGLPPDAVIDSVPAALTPKGIEFLYGAIETYTIEQGATRPEADDDTIGWVCEALSSPEAWDSLPMSTRRRVRRLMACVADIIAPE